jgi:hypothetical protein
LKRARRTADKGAVSRTRTTIAAVALVALASAILAASAAATFEATLSPRQASKRADGPTFVVEAGGGRPTRVHDLTVEGGRCGSIYAALMEAGKVSRGFANGRGAAVFTTGSKELKLRLELRLRPRGESLTASGLFTATSGSCRERIPLDLVATKIRGGGRHRQS